MEMPSMKRCRQPHHGAVFLTNPFINYTVCEHAISQPPTQPCWAWGTFCSCSEAAV